MLYLIFIAAVLISIILERQERRHLFEKSWEYRRMGKPIPRAKPKVPELESMLNVVLGLTVTGFGILFTWSNFKMLELSAQDPAFGDYPKSSEWDFVAVALATGIALTLLGVRSLRLNWKYKRENPVHRQGG